MIMNVNKRIFMGKTTRLKRSEPGHVSVEPEKRSHRDKKKEKVEQAQQNRANEKKKLQSALSTGNVDDLATPAPKNTIKPTYPRKRNDH